MTEEKAGGFKNPLDLSNLDVPLEDLKLISMLIDDEEHDQVPNLDEKKVEQLDTSAKRLGLDEGYASQRYFARTRMNDGTGNSIRCNFHMNAILANQEEKDLPLKFGNCNE